MCLSRLQNSQPYPPILATKLVELEGSDFLPGDKNPDDNFRKVNRSKNVLCINDKKRHVVANHQVGLCWKLKLKLNNEEIWVRITLNLQAMCLFLCA